MNKVTSAFIYGSGLSPLLTAITLSRKVPDLSTQLTVCLKQQDSANRAVSTPNDFRSFHNEIGLSEKIFASATQATPHLAYNIQTPENEFYFSDGDYGFVTDGICFHQLWKSCSHPQKPAMDSFSLSAQLAARAKFIPPSQDKNSILSTVRYGYSFEESLYYNLLIELAKSINIKILYGETTNIEVGNHGISKVFVNHIKIPEHTLYIDCSSERELTKHLTPNTESLIDSIPSWSTTYNSNKAVPKNIYASSIRISKKNKTIETTTPLRKETHIRSLDFDSQHSSNAGWSTRSPWTKNCIAMGGGSLQTPSIIYGANTLLHKQVLHLAEMWPASTHTPSHMKIFNRNSNKVANQIIDVDNIFIASTLDKKELLTSSNKSRIALFETAGHIYPENTPVIQDRQWPILLTALGYQQRYIDASSMNVSQEKREANLLKMYDLVYRVINHSEKNAK